MTQAKHAMGAVMLCVLMNAVPPMRAVAQQRIATQPADQPTARPARADTLLARRTTVHLTRVSLREAIDAAASSASVTVSYNAEVVNAHSGVVTVNLSYLPLSDVLNQILTGTGLQVVTYGVGYPVIVPVNGTHAAPGEILGRVTDAKTKQPLKGASITLDSAQQVVRTDADGRYRITSVTAGVHAITIRYVGYARQNRMVTVADDGIVTLDIALDPSLHALDQVVVTATGAQRYREVGHVVSTINADSVVRDAPVTTLSELLTGRVPGLQVMNNNGGVAGGEVSLRIRGTSTLALDPQPIVIVDGIRYKSTNFTNGIEDLRPFNAEPRSPLNDLNVNDIETVEVVKGPSASTLYGPDAASGVIVVTTKHGHAGKPQWHIYAYPDLSQLSVGSKGTFSSTPLYQGWGHVPGTSDLYQGQCTLRAQANQECVFDSLTTVKNPVDDPQLSVVTKQRPQWHSGASVSGGTPALQYFYSGNYDSQTGALRMSPVAQDVLKTQLGVSKLSDAILNPNTQQTVSPHANISSKLNEKTNVTFVGNYTQVRQRAIDVSNLFQGQYIGTGGPPPGTDSATLVLVRNSLTYAGQFLQTTQQRVQRLTAAFSAIVKPLPWLDVDANAGTDLDFTTDQAIRQAGALYVDDGGEADDQRRTNTGRNAHVAAKALAHAGSWTFRTVAGVDYNYQNLDGLLSSATGLASGSSDLTTGSSQSSSRVWNETVQLGTYGEEVVGWRDRLFLTGSLRLDGSTSFGDKYAPRPFPKVNASWVVSDEPLLAPLQHRGLDELRLRYSFGASSRSPTSAMKLGQIIPFNLNVEGATHGTFYNYTLPSPFLKPERGQEEEYGFDATLWSVLRAELTWYRRNTYDALQVLGAPNGFISGWANVGDISSRGTEVVLDFKPYESNFAALDFRFEYARNTNTLLSIGSGLQIMSETGSRVVGYPLNSAFASRTIGVADTVHGASDGYVEYTEVVRSPVEYIGPLIAPQTYTFTPSVALFGGRVRVSSLFYRQAGGVAFNGGAFGCASNSGCPSNFLPGTSLLEQAKTAGFNRGDFMESSNYTRWQDLTVSGNLPTAWRTRLHLSRAAASFQVHNLAIWTPFRGPDPESVAGLGTTAIGTGPNGTIGIPQPRTWTIRFDVSP